MGPARSWRSRSLPWQWQDIAFLQPPGSHKASRQLQLCLAKGCAVHTKHSCLSSIPSWEPTPEHARKKQQELELPASFPRLENPRSLQLPVLPPSAHVPIPPASYFLHVFLVAKFSLCCFFHLLPVTCMGGIPLNLSKAQEVHAYPAVVLVTATLATLARAS